MMLMSLLYCYGASLQNEENRLSINSKATIEALKVMREIFKRGMTDEVFAWTTASNNDAFLAGRLSLAVNAISIRRTAGDRRLALADDTWLAPIPRGPVRRLGNEHVMGIYFIWKFAKNKEAAKQFLVDQQLGYRQHFMKSKYYNFPAWTNSIKGGFKSIRKICTADKHKPLAVQHPHVDRGEQHDERRLPRLRERRYRGDLHPGGSSRRCSPRWPRQDDAAGGGQGCRSPVQDHLQEVARPGAGPVAGRETW